MSRKANNTFIGAINEFRVLLCQPQQLVNFGGSGIYEFLANLHSWILTTTQARATSVHVSTGFSLHPIPDFHRYFVAYLKTDPAKEPLATGESIPGIIADAAAKTGRHRTDFEVEEISPERFQKLKAFLAE